MVPYLVSFFIVLIVKKKAHSSSILADFLKTQVMLTTYTSLSLFNLFSLIKNIYIQF